MLRKVREIIGCADTSARALYGDSPWRFVKYARVSLFSLNRFSVFHVDGPSYVPPFASPRLEEWSMEKLDAYRRGKNLPKQFYADRLNGFRRVWVYTENGTVAYIIWVCEPAGKSSFLYLGGGDVELSYALTMPEFRRRGLHKQGLANLMTQLRREGHRHIYTVVHDGNSNGVRAAEASGMRLVGAVYALGPFRFRKKSARLRADRKDGT